MDADYLDSLVKRGVISDDVAARMMTHQPEQPNPMRPIVDAARGYLQSGDFNPAHEPGTQPRDYLRELLRNPDILAKNVDQASQFNFGGMARPAFWTNPAKAARADELITRGFGRQAVADDIGVGKAAIGRYLDFKGEKTAAAENSSFWESNPGSVDQLKTWKRQGVSEATIAQRFGIKPGAVSTKIRTERTAGRWEDYVTREPSFWDDANAPKRAEFMGDVKAGRSLRELARKYETSSGRISSWIHELQARHGELLDWAPQGLRGVAAYTGKKPTVVQTKTQARPVTPEDLEVGRDFTKALSAFTQDGPQR